jgi:single-stranded-DNA-specific exonuclease
MTQFGGHSQAAGFTLPTANLPRLQEMMAEMANNQLSGADLRPTIDIDAEAFLPELGGDTFQITQQLAPFGAGNPAPTFLSRGVEVLTCRTMGNDNGHLRLKVKQGNSVWDAVAFGLGDRCHEVCPLMDIVYNLEVDRWGGKETLRLNLLDLAPNRYGHPLTVSP